MGEIATEDISISIEEPTSGKSNAKVPQSWDRTFEIENMWPERFNIRIDPTKTDTADGSNTTHPNFHPDPFDPINTAAQT